MTQTIPKNLIPWIGRTASEEVFVRNRDKALPLIEKHLATWMNKLGSLRLDVAVVEIVLVKVVEELLSVINMDKNCISLIFWIMSDCFLVSDINIDINDTIADPAAIKLTIHSTIRICEHVLDIDAWSILIPMI